MGLRLHRMRDLVVKGDLEIGLVTWQPADLEVALQGGERQVGVGNVLGPVYAGVDLRVLVGGQKAAPAWRRRRDRHDDNLAGVDPGRSGDGVDVGLAQGLEVDD